MEPQQDSPGDQPCPKRPKSSQSDYCPDQAGERDEAMQFADLQALSLAGAAAQEGDALVRMEEGEAATDEEESAEWDGDADLLEAAEELMLFDAGVEARDKVLTSGDMLKDIFSHLGLEDLCRAAMVRQCWRDVTSDPEFWHTINLKGRTLMVSKVRALLSRHTSVRVLNARGVAFTLADLAAVLPNLNLLESLELEKNGYERAELEVLGNTLPSLTRLVLAGGSLGLQLSHEWTSLAHPRVEVLELESARATRLKISAPQLTTLSLRDFSAAALQLLDGGRLTSLSVAECNKLTDGALRGLLCVEGPGATALPALTSVRLAGVPNVSDETLRLAGQRHPALARLELSGCSALTGGGLTGANGAYPALRSLSVEFCDAVSGNNLSDAVQQLRALEELRVTGCAQVTTLRLQSAHLARLALTGTRALQELDLRCARLAEVDIAPLNPGLAASLALRRVMLASHAVERLQWSAFPALETVRLQCPNLRELDLSECRALRDTVFESLGSRPPGSGGPGGYIPADPAQPLQPGCPQLRSLKLGDCEALRHAVLCSETLESLQLSQCSWLRSVELKCPMLTQLSLEECTSLEGVKLSSRCMTGMSLGTCPRLGRITIACDSMQHLDLRGCNQLEQLQLSCPSLRSVDATFCKSLSDAALHSIACCPALEELILAACDSVTMTGLGALSQLASLRKLDLSYTPLEDPAPIYEACRQLTSLTLSNNYALQPATLLPLFPPLEGEAEQAAEEGARPGSSAGAEAAAQLAALSPAAGSPPMLPSLRALDIGYCSMPSSVLATIVRRAARLHALSINGCRGGVTDALWPLLHRPAAAAAGDALCRVAVTPAKPAGATPPTPALSAPSPLPLGRLFEPLAPGLAGASLPDLEAGFGGSQQRQQVATLPEHDFQQQQQAGPASPGGRSRPFALRSLSMVGSKELRHVCLGLMPAADALHHRLLISGATVAVTASGQQYVPVESVLDGLTELRLSLSTRLRSLALGLPRLQDLQLNNCSELATLVLHCPHLARLALQACRGLPEGELVGAVRRCTALRELDLQYCPQVTTATVAALRAACPQIETIHTTTPRAASPP